MASPKYQQHPVAKFIPPANEQDYESLKADISAKGQLEPIRLYEGKVIDGWTRYRVCEELGREPIVEEWRPEPAQSVVGAVVSWNLPRRHLSSAQKAALALLIEPELAKEAKARQEAAGRANLKLRGQPKPKARVEAPDGQQGAESEEPVLVEGKEAKAAGAAAEQAARIAGTNRQYVHDVKRIKQYSERLFQSVLDGEMAITDAKKLMRRKQKKAQLRKAAKEVVRTKGKPSYKIEVSDVIQALNSLEKATVRLVITEPPFTQYGSPPKDPGRWQWAEQWMGESFRCLTPDGSMWIVCDPAIEHRFRTIADRIGMTTRLFPWYYTYGKPRGGDFSDSYLAVLRCRVNNKRFVFNPAPFTLETGKIWNDVWGIDQEIRLLADNSAERILDFPQQMPLALARPIVEAHSEPGDMVVELFAGAATAGVVCLELGGRRYLGIEQSPRLAQLAIDRLASVRAAKQPKELEA